MDNTSNLSILKPKLRDPNMDLYGYFSRPLTSKLLEAMELAKHFKYGDGDYLFYEENGKIQKVLDLTGGYGANFLGHRNPRILDKIKEWQESGAPSLAQGSLRLTSGVLAKKISDTLENETSEGPWVTTFSNSGTEAIEAALKHCLIHFKHKVIQVEQEINKEINLAVLKLKRLSPSEISNTVNVLRLDLSERIEHLKMTEEKKSWFLHQISNVHNLDELVDLVREVNKTQLGQRPYLVALEKSFHGKTMGALSLTSSEQFKLPFFLDEQNNPNTIFISQYIDQEDLQKIIDGTHQDLVILAATTKGFSWVKYPVSLISGVFIEPIQGEAGVITVMPSFLALIKKHSLKENFLIVFDEIQAGLYRTGKFASGNHTDITADIYTFSKSLGGGVAKIAATSIIKDKYVEEFGFVHTSTFSDDDFSSGVALEVLNILQEESSPIHEAMRTGDYLNARLTWLKSQYPECIQDVRGRGLMLAIEFKDIFPEMGFEFKGICDVKMQGYLMASALLNNEKIRMSPSLSNSLTLRIQPSVYFKSTQADQLIMSLVSFCEALKNRDVKYFLSAMYPGENVYNRIGSALATKLDTGKRPLAVFLCHVIDGTHVKHVTKALKDVSTEKLLKKLTLTKDLAEFEIYHSQTMKNEKGEEMDIILMAILITSEELKKTFASKNKYQIVGKIQSAIDYAKSLGANTVGLGQFTSIVSGNGLYLDPRGMNLTTGNAYTIALTVESALRSAKEKHIKLEETTVALIGAVGNIMSVATSLMADHVGKIIMVHHTPIETSLKYQETTKRILNEIAHSSSSSRVSSVVKKHWKRDGALNEFLAIPEVIQTFQTTSEISEIKNADIVICGASASNSFLTLELLKENAIIVDVAVPPTVKSEMLSRMETERPDLTYHLGGVAKIPHSQNINAVIFPLTNSECYACMAETFSIGFSARNGFLNIGDLNKNIVLAVQELATEAGFILGSNKGKNPL